MELDVFYKKLLESYPESQPKLTTFPSGAFMIDLEIGGIAYVAEYLPSLNGYGLSRLQSETFGWEGVEQSFSSLGDLSNYIFRVLDQNRGKNEPDNPHANA